jgi:predicted TPR repeat methyltransferase
MQSSPIAAAYDQLAERWLDDRFNQANGVAQHVRALAFLGIDSGGWALNVGCGCNTRLNPPMRACGLQIEGIDMSARMLALARAADPDVVLHHADAVTWQAPRSYRFITAWDSIWHVQLAQQAALLQKLMAALAPGGVFIFSMGGLDAPAEHVDDAMGPAVYYASPGIPALLQLAADALCVCRHLEFDQYPLKHLSIIVQKAGGEDRS